MKPIGEAEAQLTDHLRKRKKPTLDIRNNSSRTVTVRWESTTGDFRVEELAPGENLVAPTHWEAEKVREVIIED